MIRAFAPKDVDKLREIHEKFYKDEFDFPDFFDKFLGAFIIIEDDEIVLAGGVRTITEAVIVTNKDLSPRRRTDGLLEMMGYCAMTCKRFNYKELHAFIINNGRWQEQLVRTGFRPTKGNSLVLQIPE